MEDHLYIVLWRGNDTSKWSVELGGIVDNAADRDIIIAAAKIRNPDFKFAWVEGPIFSPEAMAECEAAMEAF